MNAMVDILTLQVSFKKYLANSKFIINYQNSFDIAFALKLSGFFTTSHSFTTDFSDRYIIGHSFAFSARNFLTCLSIFQQNGYLATAKGIGVNFSFGYSW
jgi:hypothetical protein